VNPPFRPLYREGRILRLLDQRLLPAREVWLELEKAPEIAIAIRDMAVRGAPAIGVAAAYGAAFSMRSGQTTPVAERFETARGLLGQTRPTAVNLFAALDRLARRFQAVREEPPEQIERALVEEADALAAEDLAACLRIGELGAELLPRQSTVLTHCNAGALATAGYGTALGVIRGAVASGRTVRVLAGEAGIAIENARLFAEEQKKSRHLTLLNNISSHAITTLNPDEMLAKIAAELEDGLTYDHIGIAILDYSAKELVVQADAGQRRGAVGRRIALGEGLVGQVARTGQMGIVSEVS